MRVFYRVSLSWPLLVFLFVSGTKAVAIEPFVSSTNNTIATISTQTSTDLSTYVYHSTHPSIHYLPRSDCVHRIFGKWCKGRNYAWKRQDYVVESRRKSVAEVNNEHNNGYGNGAREVRFDLPSGESRSMSLASVAVPGIRSNGFLCGSPHPLRSQ